MHSYFPRLATFLNHLNERLPDRFERAARKLTPATNIGLLVCMIGFGRCGYRRVIAELQRGLQNVFAWEDVSQIPSAQAFGRARRKLTRAICDQALALVRDICSIASADQIRRYAGLRLVGIDATKLSLPPTPALLEAFGVPRNQQGSTQAPMAGLVQLWDVGANMPISFALTACDFDERVEGTRLFDLLGPDDLLIGDRGYPSYDVFRALCRRRCRFILRCSRTLCTEVTAFVNSGADEAVVRLIKRGYKGRRRDGTPAIPVRLIRVALPNGSIEVLATNLWRERGHDREAVARLYTDRWRIETAFREMKVFHALENFSATYPDGIYQEIVAIQIFLAMAGELEAMARHKHQEEMTKAHQKPQQASKTESQPDDYNDHIRFNRLMITDAVIAILRIAAGDPEEVRRVTQVSITAIWKSRSKRRDGRSYPRERKRSTRGYKASGK